MMMELIKILNKVKMIAFDLKQFAEKLEDFQDGVVWAE